MSSITNLISVGVNGTGTANSVMKWLDADTATDSIITDNGSTISIGGSLAVDTNTLYVDSANNRVGIGTSSPETRLTVYSPWDANSSSRKIWINSKTDNSRQAYIEETQYSNDARRGFKISGCEGGINNGGFIETANTFVRIGVFQTERMRIDASGNVGIGTSSPAYKLDVKKTDAAGIYARFGASSDGGSRELTFSSSDDGIFLGAVHTINATSGAGVIALAQGGVERMRVSSGGSVLIGTTATTFFSGNTAYSPKFAVDAGSGNLAYFKTATDGTSITINNAFASGTRFLISFDVGNARVGNITSNGSSTTYGTTSDYRLKENVVPMSGALDRVSQLQPARFNFIADPETTVDGFLAHQVQEVVPEAITGVKDEVDAEGNPIYQGIDQSKLVPLLVGAIKELRAEIETLKSQING